MSTPAIQFDSQLLLKAQGQTSEGIRLVILDVDGVLTDGRLYYTAEGETLKAFHVLDGYGILLLKEAGFQVAVITGRDSPALRSRFSDLKVEKTFYGVKDKAKVATELLTELGLSWKHVAVIGDDWPDIPLFKQAAFCVAPPSAHADAKALAHYITQKEGGQGAVREFCDILLMAGGHYGQLYSKYVG
ncbi:MAG: KdsC family phosphatase [Saezia sp.]